MSAATSRIEWGMFPGDTVTAVQHWLHWQAVAVVTWDVVLELDDL